jgi:hypothetical protein
VFAYDGDYIIKEANSSGGAVARYAQQGLNTVQGPFKYEFGNVKGRVAGP